MEERQPEGVCNALWAVVLPLNTQEFMYKLLSRKLVVHARIGLWRQDIDTKCSWCNSHETEHMYLRCDAEDYLIYAMLADCLNICVE